MSSQYELSFSNDGQQMQAKGVAYNKTLDLVYNGELGKYYMFRSVGDMPYIRQFKYEQILQSAQLGYTKKDITIAFQTIKDYCTTDEIGRDQLKVDVAHIATEMLKNLQDSTDLMNLYLLSAPLMIVEENADIADISEDNTNDFINKFKKIPSTLAFFLQLLQQKLINTMSYTNEILQQLQTPIQSQTITSKQSTPTPLQVGFD
jgi:hypothetical protein